MVPVGIGGFGADQHRRHDAQIMQAGRAAVAHARPPAARVEPVEHGQATADRDHRHEGIGHRVHVEDRQRRDHPLAILGQRAQPPASAYQRPAIRK
jgi:hypothetical protein